MTGKLTIQQVILRVIHEHSGGLKKIELISNVADYAVAYQIEGLTSFSGRLSHISALLDRELLELEREGKVKIVKYAWLIGDRNHEHIVREKEFICTPMETFTRDELPEVKKAKEDAAAEEASHPLTMSGDIW